QAPSDTRQVTDRNVLGGELEPCGADPLTGFYRDGCCRTGPEDQGSHTICAVVTAAFLEHQQRIGNDLITPVPEYRFPGLAPGDRWCDRDELAAGARGRRGRLRGSGIYPRASTRDRLARRASRARRRRASHSVAAREVSAASPALVELAHRRQHRLAMLLAERPADAADLDQLAHVRRTPAQNLFQHRVR